VLEYVLTFIVIFIVPVLAGMGLGLKVKRALAHIFRGTAAVLAVVLVGNSVAFAAGAPLDPVKLKQKLTARGIGNSVKVTELDGSTVSGRLTAIRDDAFDVTGKKAAQPITIPYAQLSKVGNGGLSTGAKIGIVVGSVAVIVVVSVVLTACNARNAAVVHC
jgi:hypothetical protein